MKSKFELASLLAAVVALCLAGPPTARAQLADAPEAGNGSAAKLDVLRAMASRGDLEAEFRLGELYEQGALVERDLAKAVAAYRRAAEQGHAGAQYALAHVYHIGSGVEQDMAAAMAWYRKAAQQGNEAAQLALGDQYRIGLVVPQDPVQSTRWYRMAADQGNAFAQYELGNAYRYGNGVEPDAERAIEWYRLAAAAGNPSAQLALAELEGGGGAAPQPAPAQEQPQELPETEAAQDTGWDLAAEGGAAEGGAADGVAADGAAENGAEPDAGSFEAAMAAVAAEKGPPALPERAAPVPDAAPVAADAVPATGEELAFATLPSPGDDRQVFRLLTRARAQFASLALTTPAGDNAYETYQRVLSVQPDNAAALDGIERIGVKYVELADAAAAKGEIDHFRQYAAKASVLAPEHPKVLALTLAGPAEPPAAIPARTVPDEVPVPPVAPREREDKATAVQVAAATPATDTLEQVTDSVDDVVLKPHDYRSRQVAVAGSVVHLFWDYRLVSEDGQNSMVIDTDALSPADRAKLEDAVGRAGLLAPVRVLIAGTVERGSLTYQLAATDVSLTGFDPSRDDAASPAGGREAGAFGAASLSVGPGDSFGRTGLNGQRTRSGDRGAGAGSAASGGSASGGSGSGGSGSGGADSGGADGGGSGGSGSGGDGSGGSGSGSSSSGGSGSGSSSSGGDSGGGDSGGSGPGASASSGGSDSDRGEGGRSDRGRNDRGRGDRGRGSRGRDG